MKKAQGISLNVVVIAAIALLVLVILTVIVIQRSSKIPEALTCSAQPGGECMEQCGGDHAVFASQYDCPAGLGGETLKCCLPSATEGVDNGPSSALP